MKPLLDTHGAPPRPLPVLLQAPIAVPVAQMRMRGVIASPVQPGDASLRRRKPETARGR